MLPTQELGTMVLTQDVPGLIRELGKRISYEKLQEEVGIPSEKLSHYEASPQTFPREYVWKLIRAAYKHNLFELLPAHGVPVISYDIRSPFDILNPPLGFEEDPPLFPLLKEPTTIAGLPVDFPLGLPASVLAANSQWIKFYAHRGFDILTYKTVRTEYRQPHKFPNWVFLENPEAVAQQLSPEHYDSDKKAFHATASGYPGFWPDDLRTLSMANSFGVPSLLPAWWKEDIREARKAVREGHQVLIVSIVGSKSGKPDDPPSLRRKIIADDFIEAAIQARDAGADIIEANFSCPNVIGDPVGDLYHYAEDSGYVSTAIKNEIGTTPLFVKIGYLPMNDLRRFVEFNPALDGIVAINTISARIINEEQELTFGDKRPTAGVSGWAIKRRAQEVAANLVSIRRDICATGRKHFTILSVGGVVQPQDYDEYIKLGVDGVESCTGAFLNPYLGFDIRLDRQKLADRPRGLAFELKYMGTVLREMLAHPNRPSSIRADERTGMITVERG